MFQQFFGLVCESRSFFSLLGASNILQFLILIPKRFQLVWKNVHILQDLKSSVGGELLQFYTLITLVSLNRIFYFICTHQFNKTVVFY